MLTILPSHKQGRQGEKDCMSDSLVSVFKFVFTCECLHLSPRATKWDPVSSKRINFKVPGPQEYSLITSSGSLGWPPPAHISRVHLGKEGSSVAHPPVVLGPLWAQTPTSYCLPCSSLSVTNFTYQTCLTYWFLFLSSFLTESQHKALAVFKL